jgi:Rrf2 family protein
MSIARCAAPFAGVNSCSIITTLRVEVAPVYLHRGLSQSAGAACCFIPGSRQAVLLRGQAAYFCLIFKERQRPSNGTRDTALMKLTRAASYALHAVVYMAAQKSDKPVASHHIAAARGIPERFLLKVLKPLVSARILTSVKGPNGGYRLARSPNDISMLEVLEAVEGPVRGIAPATEEKNPLNGKLDVVCRDAAESVRKQFDKIKIGELAGSKR